MDLIVTKLLKEDPGRVDEEIYKMFESQTNQSELFNKTFEVIKMRGSLPVKNNCAIVAINDLLGEPRMTEFALRVFEMSVGVFTPFDHPFSTEGVVKALSMLFDEPKVAYNYLPTLPFNIVADSAEECESVANIALIISQHSQRQRTSNVSYRSKHAPLDKMLRFLDGVEGVRFPDYKIGESSKIVVVESNDGIYIRPNTIVLENSHFWYYPGKGYESRSSVFAVTVIK